MSQLEKIAERLKREAKEHGKAQYKLKHGLLLSLFWKDGNWNLALSRQTQKPSDVERHTCEKAFGIPKPPDRQWKRTYAKPWHHVWYQWSEATQETFGWEVETPVESIGYYKE